MSPSIEETAGQGFMGGVMEELESCWSTTWITVVVGSWFMGMMTREGAPDIVGVIV